MHTAAITSHAALMVSPRESATMPMDTVPSAITPAHKSLFWIPLDLMAISGMAFLLAPAPPSRPIAPAAELAPALKHNFQSIDPVPFDRDQTAAAIVCFGDGVGNRVVGRISGRWAA